MNEQTAVTSASKTYDVVKSPSTELQENVESFVEVCVANNSLKDVNALSEYVNCYKMRIERRAATVAYRESRRKYKNVKKQMENTFHDSLYERILRFFFG